MASKLKHPLEMIAEWRKGCSVAGLGCGQDDSPANCFECTEALIEALENVLRDPSVEMIEDVAGSCEWDYRSDGKETRAAAALIWRVMAGAEPSPFERLHDAPDPPPVPTVFAGEAQGAPVRPEGWPTQWSRERVGTVDGKGNIIGPEPGVAYSSGVIWLKNEEEAKRAEAFGWRRTGQVASGGRFHGLVAVERAHVG